MISAQTISVFEAFAVWENPFEGSFISMTPAGHVADKGRIAALVNAERGRKYLERLQFQRARMAENVDSFRLNWGARSQAIHSRLKMLSEAEEEDARAVLLAVLRDYEAIGKKILRVSAKALKMSRSYKSWAVKTYPVYRRDFIEVFDNLARLCSEYVDEFEDSSAALRAFIAELDPESRTGPTFSSPEALEQYLAAL